MDSQKDEHGIVSIETPPEIRQNLIDTAVQFLNMNNILSQPENMKRQFLEKKGLTKEEIEMAVQQSKAQQINNVHSSVPAHNYIPQNQLSVLPPNLPVPYIPPSTFWTKLRHTANMVIFLSGVAFGFKYLYKYYIAPFLTGQAPKSREDSLLEVQVSVIQVLKQIESTLEKINKNISDQNERKVEEDVVKRLENGSINELKTELTTIKSLLINKKSFPATPALSPSIPSWQKRSLALVESSPEVQNDAEAVAVATSKELISNGEGTDKQTDMKVCESVQEENGVTS